MTYTTYEGEARDIWVGSSIARRVLRPPSQDFATAVWEKRADTYLGMLRLACALISWRAADWEP